MSGLTLSRHSSHVDLYVRQGELALQRDDRTGAAAAFRAARMLRPEATRPRTLAAIYGAPAVPPAWIEQLVAALTTDLREGQPWPGSMLELAGPELAHEDKGAAVMAIAHAV